MLRCTLTCCTMASGSTEPDIAETLVSKRNSTSIVWDYFGFKKEDVAQRQVLSKTCLANVVTSWSNITNLIQHLKKTTTKPCTIAAWLKKPNTSVSSKPNTTQQASLTEMFDSVTPYERASKRHVEITQAVTEFIAKGMMPQAPVFEEQITSCH